MAKRKQPWKRHRRGWSPQVRRRAVLAVMVATALVTVAGFVVTRLPWHAGLPDGDHPHQHPPHGGTVVSVGPHDHHDHAEVVFTNGVVLYTFGEDFSRPLGVPPRALTAFARPDGEGQSTAIPLMPVRQSGDPDGKTSRFLGKLPRDLWGKPLTLTIQDLAIGEERFRVEFPRWAGAGKDEVTAWVEQERALYRATAGKYGNADVQANGTRPASEKFAGLDLDHEQPPRPGDPVCPVTWLKASPRISWVVDGKTYAFCCPPCVDEFLQAAKQRPAEVKDPEHYVQK